MAGENLKSSALVTGAAGFIGSHLTRALLSKGVDVHAWCRRSNQASRLKDISSRIHLHPVDLTQEADVHASLKHIQPDYIFHLAAYRSTDRSPEVVGRAVQNNFLGTMNLLTSALSLNKKVKRIIITGSSEEYGGLTPPLHEGLREAPVSPYSASKTAAIHVGQTMARTFGLPVVALRPFLTYGPAQDADMFIPSLIEHALSGRDFKMTQGRQLREFNFVSDVVNGFLLAAAAPGIEGEVINIGNGDARSMSEIADLIVKKCGGMIQLLKGALPTRAGESSLYCDNSKARQLLGWRPLVGLEEGLDITIQWIKQNGPIANLVR